ncbi:unnamed protein product [Durusdinium trenchii]|uniref:Kinesin light chain n=1 Tax=Durusdinium trenchii TaxID=1381693 RepID=A0ABP0NFW1_9DINO
MLGEFDGVQWISSTHGHLWGKVGELAYSPSLCLVFPLGRPEQYSPGYEALDPSSEELEAGPSKIGEPVHEAHVAEELAELLFTKAKYAAAEELRTELFRRCLHEAHAERAERLRRQLVTVLRCQGRLGEAEDLARELGTKAGDLSLLALILEDRLSRAVLRHREREKQLCATHPWTLLCYSRLAATLHARGKLPEAEDFCRRALAGSEVELNQTETLHYINRLAKVLQAQGHMQEAEELQQRMMPGLIYVESSALLCLVKGNGRMQDSTLTSLSHLGSLLHERGKLQEAEDLLRRVLSEREEMEPLHLDTLSSSCALAAVLRDAGKTQEAEELYKSALEGYEKLDPYYVETLQTATALAMMRQNILGKPRKAEELFRRVLERREEQLGRNHLQSLTAARHLAKCLRLQQKFSEAEDLQWRAMEGYEEHLGKSHPETLRVTSDLAALLQELNDLNEAERLQRWVYEERQTVLGPDHAETLSSCYALGALLETKGADADEVEELLRKALEGRQKQLGPVHAEVLEVISRLANFLEKLGEVTEAQKLYIQELQAMEELFGVGHKRTQQSRRKLEDFLRNIRESFPEEAETEVVSRTNSRTSRANSDGASRSNSVPDSGTSDGKASRRVSIAPSFYQEALNEDSDDQAEKAEESDDDAPSRKALDPEDYETRSDMDVARDAEAEETGEADESLALSRKEEKAEEESDDGARSRKVSLAPSMYQEALDPEDYETRSDMDVAQDAEAEETGEADESLALSRKASLGPSLYQEALDPEDYETRSDRDLQEVEDD